MPRLFATHKKKSPQKRDDGAAARRVAAPKVLKIPRVVRGAARREVGVGEERKCGGGERAGGDGVAEPLEDFGAVVGGGDVLKEAARGDLVAFQCFCCWLKMVLNGENNSTLITVN